MSNLEGLRKACNIARGLDPESGEPLEEQHLAAPRPKSSHRPKRRALPPRETGSRWVYLVIDEPVT